MWVVKLGGSLAYSAQLGGWLSVLAAAASVVIVPGGGPFADQVRQVQKHWRFDDSSAHAMALLAMQQFGTMLCALQSGLTAAGTAAELAAVLKRGETPVWMPAGMVMAAPGIAHSWEVTSDSLAAWLGGRLAADALLLVKSVPLTGINPNVDRLIEHRIVDAEFAAYLRAVDLPAWLIGARDFARFGEVLNGSMDAALQIEY